jgi:hypothetical protein
MTNIKDARPFMLYPPPHWQEVAAATKANLAAMREARNQQLAAFNSDSDQSKSAMIQNRHDEMERQLATGYGLSVKRHVDFIHEYPGTRMFRWSQSDPPGSLDKERIAPWHTESSHHHKHLQRRQRQRKEQVYKGRKIICWPD